MGDAMPKNAKPKKLEFIVLYIVLFAWVAINPPTCLTFFVPFIMLLVAGCVVVSAAVIWPQLQDGQRVSRQLAFALALGVLWFPWWGFVVPRLYF